MTMYAKAELLAMQTAELESLRSSEIKEIQQEAEDQPGIDYLLSPETGMVIIFADDGSPIPLIQKHYPTKVENILQIDAILTERRQAQAEYKVIASNTVAMFAMGHADRQLERASREETVKHAFKLLLLGGNHVGKQEIIERFTKKQVLGVISLGIDFRTTRVRVDDQVVSLKLWDTAGQERFRSITQGYIRGTQGIVLVANLGDAESFRQLRIWSKDLSQYSHIQYHIVLTGGELSEQDRVVSMDDVVALATQFGCQYTEVDLTSGRGIDQAFTVLTQAIITKQNTEAEAVSLVKPSSDNDKGCCLQ